MRVVNTARIPATKHRKPVAIRYRSRGNSDPFGNLPASTYVATISWRTKKRAVWRLIIKVTPHCRFLEDKSENARTSSDSNSSLDFLEGAGNMRTRISRQANTTKQLLRIRLTAPSGSNFAAGVVSLTFL